MTTSTESAMPPKEIGCHRTGFTKNCRALVASGACNRWQAETVTNVEKGEHVRFDCLDNWEIQYLKDNARGQISVSAALESFRNEVTAINGFPHGHPYAARNVVGVPSRQAMKQIDIPALASQPLFSE